jgi:hypothetical protein
VQLFQAHRTAVFTATVFAAGLNRLLVTEIPPAGVGVLPLGWGFGDVDPPPPHAPAEITASAIHTFLVLIRVLSI